MAAEIQPSFLLVLSALLAVGFAQPHTLEENNVGSEKVSVKINKLVDMMMPAIQNIIVRDGMDPLEITDISKNLAGFITHNGVLNLTNGWLQGLSHIKRMNDVILSYENKVLTLDMSLGFDVLSVDYEYTLKYGQIKRKGDFNGIFQNVELQLKLTLDMENYKIILQSLEIIKMQKLDIKLQGNAADPVLNLAIRAVTMTFKKGVKNIVEKRFVIIVQSLVDKINEKIPVPERLRDSFDILEIPTTFTFTLV